MVDVLRGLILAAVAAVLVGCAAIIPSMESADGRLEVGDPAPGAGGGCGPIGDAQVRDLGLRVRVPERGAITGDDLPPLRRSGSIGDERARELGLLISLPDLPRGLRLLMMDTNGPGTYVRYVLAPASVDDGATFRDVFASGGALLFVYQGAEGAVYADKAIADAEELGLGDRYAIVQVGGRRAAVSEGDDRGGSRQRNVEWSDDRWIYRLQTGFETLAQAIDLARDIQCSQEP